MCEESVFTHQAECAFTEVTEMLFTDHVSSFLFHCNSKTLKTVHIKDNIEALVLILNQIMRVFMFILECMLKAAPHGPSLPGLGH